MSLMTGLSVATFVEYGGITGTATNAQILTALQVAWEEAEDTIGTNLYPYQVSEEVHPWPANDRLQLNLHDVTTVTTLMARHDEDTCDCDVLDVTGCAILVDPELGVIDIKECGGASPCSRCSCSSLGYGKWAIVTYTAGIAHPLTDSVLLAIVLLAKDFLEVLTGGKDEFAALKQITSWRSMDYSENWGDAIKGNKFSSPSRAEMAWRLLRPTRKKRAIVLANPRKARII